MTCKRSFILLTTVAIFLMLLNQVALALCGDELYRASQTAERIEREWPVRASGDTVNVYLQNLGQRLAPEQDMFALARYVSYDWPEKWEFRAVRDTSANAFSIGNGHIYVNDGVILTAETEFQIAAILAHEISHQLAGHFCGGIASEPGTRQIGSFSQAMDLTKELEADRMALEILSEAGYPSHAMLDTIINMPFADSRAQYQRQQRIIALRKELPSDNPLPVSNHTNDFILTKRFLQR